MAIVKGINSGFVKVSPTDDPNGTVCRIAGYGLGNKDTSPFNAIKITEIGWWLNNTTSDGNFEIGIFTHDTLNNKPDNAIYIGNTNSIGGTIGWKKVTGLNISINAGTIYWIIIQVDNEITGANTNYTVMNGEYEIDAVLETIPNPWNNIGDVYADYYYAFYAVYETAQLQTSGDGLNWIVYEQ